jgi:pimeloyl-ACP methyl ester carboxylesterase
LIANQLTAAAADSPLQVERFHWGCGRVVKNFCHQDTHQDAAQRLAARVSALCEEKTYDRIYLLGFSAGTSIAIATAEQLPPACLEGVVLLGSGISSSHDMSRALQATRGGIDNFYSDVDLTILLGALLFGASDTLPFPAGGTYGFRMQTPGEAATVVMPRLRQHRWNPTMVTSGHLSNHLGYTRVAFLRDYVVPLMVARPETAVQPDTSASAAK